MRVMCYNYRVNLSKEVLHTISFLKILIETVTGDLLDVKSLVFIVFE